METEISVNKIISILIAIIVASCVLIPICNEFGNSGVGDSRSNMTDGIYEMTRGLGYDPLLGDEQPSYIFVVDEIYNAEIEEDEDGYIPNMYAVSDFKDGQYFFIGVVKDEVANEYKPVTIKSDDGKMYFTLGDYQEECWGVCTEITRTGAFSANQYIIILGAEEEYEFMVDVGGNECFIAYIGEKDKWFVTDNSNVSLNLEKAYEIEDNFDYDTLSWSYLIYYVDTKGIEGTNIFDDSFDGILPTGTLYECAEQVWAYLSDNDGDFNAIKNNVVKPITFDKWNGYDAYDYESGIEYTFNSVALLYHSDMASAIEMGTGNGGNSGNNGITGTLITIIPVFVLLAILGSIAYMFIGRNEIQ